MTRINVGIQPAALCDQHLIAEYRELPRMVAFSHTTSVIPDVPFTLNTGHMKSCVRYGAFLASRHASLVAEMQSRGFVPRNTPIQPHDFSPACRHTPAAQWILDAYWIVVARIRDRLSTMRRAPTWTKRERPEWSKP